MHVYRAYDLTLHSELAFPELLQMQDDQPPDVCIHVGLLPQKEEKPSNRGDCFWGSVESVATFVIRTGTEIWIQLQDDVEEGLLRPLILGPLMSILLRQRGLLVLHASCVLLQGHAIAFMGNSGWGKSTLAELFYNRGACLITDDVMAIHVDQEIPHVVPSYPQIKLMPDAAASLGHTPDRFPLLNSYSPKLARSIGSDLCQHPVPLRGLYVLDMGSQHQVIPLSLQEQFREVVKHSRAVGLLSAPEFRVAHLRQCTDLLHKVPLHRLQRQMSLDLLPELVDVITEDMALQASPDASQISA